ncbi:MAG: hypothetical protein ACRENK_16395 [Gemmatimonadaceae bacterium]
MIAADVAAMIDRAADTYPPGDARTQAHWIASSLRGDSINRHALTSARDRLSDLGWGLAVGSVDSDLRVRGDAWAAVNGAIEGVVTTKYLVREESGATIRIEAADIAEAAQMARDWIAGGSYEAEQCASEFTVSGRIYDLTDGEPESGTPADEMVWVKFRDAEAVS